MASDTFIAVLCPGLRDHSELEVVLEGALWKSISDRPSREAQSGSACKTSVLRMRRVL